MTKLTSRKYSKISFGGSDMEKYDITNIKWWQPSNWQEVAIFILAIFLTYWVVQIYQYNTVQNELIKNSRCYKNKHAVTAGVQYVTAKNADNKPLYTVGYNLTSKQTSIDCGCKDGTVMNKFSIPVYDLSTNSVSVVDKQCACDSPLLSASANIYYDGYPGLIRFMNTASVSKNIQNDPTIDTSFFLPTD